MEPQGEVIKANVAYAYVEERVKVLRYQYTAKPPYSISNGPIEIKFRNIGKWRIYTIGRRIIILSIIRNALAT